MKLVTIAATILGLVRVLCIVFLWAFFLETYDRVVYSRPKESLAALMLLVLVGSGLAALVGVFLSWLRRKALTKMGDPQDLAEWRCGWVDAGLAVIIIAAGSVLNAWAALLIAAMFTGAILLSFVRRAVPQRPGWTARILLPLFAALLALILGTWLLITGKISPGMLWVIIVFAGWACSMGIIRWRRPVADADVF